MGVVVNADLSGDGIVREYPGIAVGTVGDAGPDQITVYLVADIYHDKGVFVVKEYATPRVRVAPTVDPGGPASGSVPALTAADVASIVHNALQSLTQPQQATSLTPATTAVVEGGDTAPVGFNPNQ